MKEKSEKEAPVAGKVATEQVHEEKISNVSPNDLDMKANGEVKQTRVSSEGFDDSINALTDTVGKLNIRSFKDGEEHDSREESFKARGPTDGVPVMKTTNKSLHIHPQNNTYMQNAGYEEVYDGGRRKVDGDGGPEAVKYRRPTTQQNIQPHFPMMFDPHYNPQNGFVGNNLSQSSAVPLMTSQGLYSNTPHDFRFGNMSQSMMQTSQMVFTGTTSGGKVTVQSPGVTPGQNPFPGLVDKTNDELLDDWTVNDMTNPQRQQVQMGVFNNQMQIMAQQQQQQQNLLPRTLPGQTEFKGPQFNERRRESDPDSGLESADERSPAPYSDSAPSPSSTMSYPSPNSVDSGCGYSPMHEAFGAENKNQMVYDAMVPKYQGVGIASPASSYRGTPSPSATSGYGSPQRPDETIDLLNDDQLEDLQLTLEVIGQDLQTQEAKKKAIEMQKYQQQIQQKQQLCMSPPSMPQQPQPPQMPPQMPPQQQQILPQHGRGVPPASLPVTMMNNGCMPPLNSIAMNMPVSIQQPFPVMNQNQSGISVQRGMAQNQPGIPVQQTATGMPTISQPNIPIPGLVSTTTAGQTQQIIILQSSPMTTQTSQQSVVLVPVPNAPAVVNSNSNKRSTQKKTPRPILPKTTSVPISTSTSGANTMSQPNNTNVTLTSRQGPTPPNKNVQQNPQVKQQQDKLLMIARRAVADIPRDDLKKIDQDGDTYLHIAVCKTDRHMVQALLERLRREKMDELVDRENNRRQTPLYMAVFMRQPIMVMMFIKFQANVNALAQNLSADGQTTEVKAAIHVAAQQGSDYLGTLCELLKAKDISINLSNNYGQTALHCAILAHNRVKRDSQERIDSIAIIRRLIEAGADPSSQDKKSGKTPLMYAIEQRNLNLVEAILTSVDPSQVRNVVRTQAYDGSSCLKIAEGLREGYDVRVWNQLWNRLQSAANGTVSRAQTQARTDPSIPLFNEV